MDKRLKYGIATAACCAAAIAVLYFSGPAISCQVQQVAIGQDIKKYDRMQDPEFCAALNDRISSHDSQCGASLDTIDCG